MSSLTLLVIEGDDSVSRLFADFFALHNYRTDICNDGQCALQAIKGSTHYDLILVSYRIPGTEGVELVRLIRGLDHRKNTPVLMVTGSGDIEEEAFEAGVDHIMHKPIDLKMLLKTVQILTGISSNNGDRA